MKKSTLVIVGLLGITAFGFQAASSLFGDDRYAAPGVASSSNYTLDGTLEPDEIPGFALSNAAFRDNANGAVYAPDNTPLLVDGPIHLPNMVAGQPVKPLERELAALKSDIPLEVPPRFRTDADLPSLEKYSMVLVQYRTRNRSKETTAEEKPTFVDSPSVNDIAGLSDSQKAIVLKKSIRATLAANAKRVVTTQNNTPGDVLLMALPYGADAKVYQPTGAAVDPKDKTAARGNYIYSIGTLCWNYPCTGKTLLRSDGKRVFARVGAGYQHRPAAFLAMLAMANIMPNYELKVNGGIYSIGHLIASEKAAVSKGANMSMALVGLSFYSEAGDQWKNEIGETWGIEQIVTEELNRSIDQGSSDVTDWLLGLTAAVKLYEEEGKSIRGPMALAKKQLATYHEFVLSVQNDQYLWHPKFFLFKGASPDVYETLYSSGHILRWLLLSLSDSELNDPRVVRAVTSLMATINKVPTNVAAGSMTDRQLEGLAISLHALSIYNLRVFDEGQPEDKQDKDVAQK